MFRSSTTKGLGNNTDLTQLNLDDVQQIEIVEGSMGVEYGANAVSGIINIITKERIEVQMGNYTLYTRGNHWRRVQRFR